MLMIADDFLALWSDYRTLIAKFIHARIRYDTRETREDMVQEVYARAWYAMCRGYGANQHPQRWLFRIARNLIIDYYRHTSLWTMAEDPEPYLDSMLDPHDRIEQSMLVERMQYLAVMLTPAQEHVVLRRMDGYAYAEIGAEMGKGEGAVKALRHRACQQMICYLEQL